MLGRLANEANKSPPYARLASLCGPDARLISNGRS
jgi:hypothetical protein